MELYYKYNDISGMNQVYSRLYKSDKIQLDINSPVFVERRYLHDPEGEFAQNKIYEDGYFLCAYSKEYNIPIGFLEIQRNSFKGIPTSKCAINVAVDPRYRHQKVATSMIKTAIKDLQFKTSYDVLEWTCAITNTIANEIAVKNNFSLDKVIISRNGVTKLNRYTKIL